MNFTEQSSEKYGQEGGKISQRKLGAEKPESVLPKDTFKIFLTYF